MELMDMGIIENKKRFRKHLKHFHPNKYHMLIVMEQEEPADIEIKIFPMVNP